MTDIDPEIRRLIDRTEIMELVARYNWAADDGDHDAYVECFTEDGVFEVGGGAIEGHDALLAYIKGAPYGTVHITTDRVIEIEGDRATQSATFVIGRRTKDKSANALLGTGRYHDELVRTERGWRFSRRHFDSDLDFEILGGHFVGGAQ